MNHHTAIRDHAVLFIPKTICSHAPDYSKCLLRWGLVYVYERRAKTGYYTRYIRKCEGVVTTTTAVRRKTICARACSKTNAPNVVFRIRTRGIRFLVLLYYCFRGGDTSSSPVTATAENDITKRKQQFSPYRNVCYTIHVLNIMK
jgi:hypothetical protein